MRSLSTNALKIILLNDVIITCVISYLFVVVQRLLEAGTVEYENMKLSFAEHKEKRQLQREIVVTGLPDNVTHEYLELFFENKDKSGGGPLQELMIDSNTNTARIVFHASKGINEI